MATSSSFTDRKSQFLYEIDLLETCYNDLKNIDNLNDMMFYTYTNLDSLTGELPSYSRDEYINNVISRSLEIDYEKVRTVLQKINTYLSSAYPPEDSNLASGSATPDEFPTVEPGPCNILSGLMDSLYNINGCEKYYDEIKISVRAELRAHIRSVFESFACRSGDYCNVYNEIQNLIAIKEVLL